MAAFKEPWGWEERRGGEGRGEKKEKLCSEAPLISGAQTGKHRHGLPLPVSTYCYFCSSCVAIPSIHVVQSCYRWPANSEICPRLPTVTESQLYQSRAMQAASIPASARLSPQARALRLPSVPPVLLRNTYLASGQRGYQWLLFFLLKCNNSWTSSKTRKKSYFETAMSLLSSFCLKTIVAMLPRHARHPKYTRAAWPASKMLTAHISLLRVQREIMTHCMAWVFLSFVNVFVCCFIRDLLKARCYLRIWPACRAKVVWCRLCRACPGRTMGRQTGCLVNLQHYQLNRILLSLQPLFVFYIQLGD